jgi:anti-sigma regulatory factor (Ser/Thr protein kinase)
MARRVAPPATADTVELVVSELVTNAVLHGGSEVLLMIANLGDRVRVEVSDSSPCLPQVVHTDLGAHGRGLQLVDALATRWGSEPTVTGKMVWCEVSPEISGLLPRIAGGSGPLTSVH